jgi:hypothetical protein
MILGVSTRPRRRSAFCAACRARSARRCRLRPRPWPWRLSPTAGRVDTTGLKVRITHPFHAYAGREFDLICRRRHWGEDRATTGGFARPQVLAFQRRLLAPAPQAMHVAAWSDSGRLPRPDASCCGVSLPVLGESNPPFTSGDDSWRLRRDLDYWVMTPQAMRSPALPAGSLL